MSCSYGMLQRDQAAHAHSSNRQTGDELVSAQAQLAEQQARLTREADRRRNAEALLQEGLQVQNQILLGLQVCTVLACACHIDLVCILHYVPGTYIFRGKWVWTCTLTTACMHACMRALCIFLDDEIPAFSKAS